MEMKKAPWKFALRPPDTVADIISGTWLDDGDELVFINTKVIGERAGFVTGETPDGDGDLELSYIGYRAPNEFLFQGPEEEGYYYAVATVIGDTILWDNGTTSIRAQRRYRDLEKPARKLLCGEWICADDNASEDEASTTVYFVDAIGRDRVLYQILPVHDRHFAPARWEEAAACQWQALWNENLHKRQWQAPVCSWPLAVPVGRRLCVPGRI